jgi:hypothetical protein
MTKEFADVAQLVEQLIRNQQVNGSSPFVGSIKLAACRGGPAIGVQVVYNRSFCFGVLAIRAWLRNRAETLRQCRAADGCLSAV